jgi:hypothetical protein
MEAIGGNQKFLRRVKGGDGCPQLLQYMERMYARPNAPLRIAAAFASLNA